MSISLYKIKKWRNMLLGKSIHHVNQDEGKIYSKTELRGYYNNLTEKVTLGGNYDIPKSYVDSGSEIFFAIEIFQYGLGAYDLFLLSGKQDMTMLNKTIACANWAVNNQQDNGAWLTFAHVTPDFPYSAMAQGEAISLLCRAYIETKDIKYHKSIKKAKNFMLLPIEQGGTTKYEEGDIFLYEYTNNPLVLNGWIFSIWGLMDYCKIEKDEHTHSILEITLHSLEKKIPDFSLNYWSKYDDGRRICSPFYHKLHIAQLNVMYDLTKHTTYKHYAELWQQYYNNWVYRKYAFVKKAIQKILE